MEVLILKKIVENIVQQTPIELEACPFCETHDLYLATAGKFSFVSCMCCGTSGPHCLQEANAILLWNNRS